ncbi:MAG: hypothetical protein ACRDSN_06730 [Pseudonocardiaceae bacterium]
MSALAPRSPLPPGSSGIRFGQVWESPDEAIGSMRYLVVSSDAYNTAFGDRRVIAVEVDSRAVYQGAYREPIVDAGPHTSTGSPGSPAVNSPSSSPNSTPTATPPSPASFEN